MPTEPNLTALWESIGVPNKSTENGQKEPTPVVIVGLSEWLASQRAEELLRLIRPKSATGPVSRVFSLRSTAFTDTDKDQNVQEYNSVHVDMLVAGTTPSARLRLYSVPFGAGDAVAIQLPDPAADQIITASKSFDCKVGSAFLRAALTDLSGTTPSYTLIITPFNDAGPANGQTEQVFRTIAYSTAQTATTIKTGAGVLHSVTILGGTAGAVTLWDNTAGSGTTILPAFTPGAVSVPVTILLDVAFTIGLTVTTAANTVIQFSYR